MRSEKGLLLTVIQGNNLPEPEDNDNNTLPWDLGIERSMSSQIIIFNSDNFNNESSYITSTKNPPDNDLSSENGGNSNHNSLDKNPFIGGATSICSQNCDYKLATHAPPCYIVHKRTYHEHAFNRKTPTIDTSSPTKKARLHAQSSIRKAIEKKGEPQGLLQYFKKATKVEHQEYLDRSTAEAKESAENEQWKKNQHENFLQGKKRQYARERKQKQREREKKRQVSCGLRSPGGTKIKVNM